MRKANEKMPSSWEGINPKKYSEEVPPHSILTFIMTHQSFQALSSVRSSVVKVVEFLRGTGDAQYISKFKWAS